MSPAAKDIVKILGENQEPENTYRKMLLIAGFEYNGIMDTFELKTTGGTVAVSISDMFINYADLTEEKVKKIIAQAKGFQEIEQQKEAVQRGQENI